MITTEDVTKTENLGTGAEMIEIEIEIEACWLARSIDVPMTGASTPHLMALAEFRLRNEGIPSDQLDTRVTWLW